MGERMAGADAAWLHMDRPTNRMIVNLVLSFERQPDWDAVRAAVRERLVTPYPRLRQRVAEPAIALPPMSVPQWVDDPEFRFEDHLRHAALAEPGDAATLHAYIESHVTDALDPARPLWQMHFIDNYNGGSALLLRAHHALGDGTALMHAMLALSDGDSRDAQGSMALTGPPSDGAGGPSGYQAVRTSITKGLSSLPRAFAGDPAHREAADARVHSLTKLALVRQDRLPVLRKPLGTRKSLAWCKPLSLQAIKAAAKNAGVTVNDVLLGVIAAGLGRYLREHGTEVDEIGAMLPFNLRALDEPLPRSWGNKFGLVYPVLPVGPMDQGERVTRIHQAMRQVKLANQAHVVFGWVSSVGLTHRRLENVLIDRYAGMSSVIISNVTGPRHQLSIAGAPVSSIVFWVPTSGPVGVGLSLISYAGNVTLGIMVDSQLVPDVDRLRELLDAELLALLEDASTS
jgi:diacylglycerol O-acyltransferase